MKLYRHVCTECASFERYMEDESGWWVCDNPKIHHIGQKCHIVCAGWHSKHPTASLECAWQGDNNTFNVWQANIPINMTVSSNLHGFNLNTAFCLLKICSSEERF